MYDLRRQEVAENLMLYFDSAKCSTMRTATPPLKKQSPNDAHDSNERLQKFEIVQTEVALADSLKLAKLL